MTWLRYNNRIRVGRQVPINAARIRRLVRLAGANVICRGVGYARALATDDSGLLQHTFYNSVRLRRIRLGALFFGRFLYFTIVFSRAEGGSVYTDFNRHRNGYLTWATVPANGGYNFAFR